MKKQLINPPQRYDGKPHGLSHAVVDTASGTVYISGQKEFHTAIANQLLIHVTKPFLVKGSRIDRVF
jgi:hypothetical protein